MHGNANMTDGTSCNRPSFRRNILGFLIALFLGTVVSGGLSYLTITGVMTAFASEAMVNDLLMDAPYLILAAAILYLPYPIVAVGSGAIAAEVIYSQWGSKRSVLAVVAGILATLAFSQFDFLFYKDSKIGTAAAFVAILAYWIMVWLPSMQAGKTAAPSQ